MKSANTNSLRKRLGLLELHSDATFLHSISTTGHMDTPNEDSYKHNVFSFTAYHGLASICELPPSWLEVSQEAPHAHLQGNHNHEMPIRLDKPPIEPPGSACSWKMKSHENKDGMDKTQCQSWMENLFFHMEFNNMNSIPTSLS